MPPRPFQAPEPRDIRIQGRDLFDEVTIPALAIARPEDMQRFREMFAEGYLHGYVKGATETLEQLLPEAPDTPEALLPSATPTTPTTPEQQATAYRIAGHAQPPKKEN